MATKVAVAAIGSEAEVDAYLAALRAKLLVVLGARKRSLAQ